MRKGAPRQRFLVAATLTAVLLVVLLAAPFFVSSEVNTTNLAESLRAPGVDGFVLGSDALGRDVLERTLAGGAESVTLGFAVLAVVLVLGTGVGLVAGFFGGIVDAVLSKIITAFQAFPSFVLAVAIAGILGQGVVNMVIAIAAVYWTQYARLVRGIAMAFKHSECVSAARLCGAPARALLTRYFVPEVAGPLAILSAVSMSDIVLTMAGLSFIGLGPARPTNEWGAMMADATSTFQLALWCMLVPMAALLVTVIMFNLVGDTLRDALDVRTHHVPVKEGALTRLRRRWRAGRGKSAAGGTLDATREDAVGGERYRDDACADERGSDYGSGGTFDETDALRMEEG